MALSMSRVEFIALIAILFAIIAFSIDSMLPRPARNRRGPVTG
ncbi:hypothetical protein P775_14725 [Puniceibacterium antarcticum]|uniref:Uncharacterized protein n=1 Tax=Puniceibacterium antarcticum TaxID=1206336 RepID=A0A2G8RD25_9RHOB|nr:hypothetical protein P775_14725 [Puniceibacterium antarcticum]